MKRHLSLKTRLKDFRTQKGLSQTELADMVGSSRNTITSIEIGKFCPSAYLAYLLCIALDCKFEELFYIEEE